MIPLNTIESKALSTVKSMKRGEGGGALQSTMPKFSVFFCLSSGCLLIVLSKSNLPFCSTFKKAKSKLSVTGGLGGGGGGGNTRKTSVIRLCCVCVVFI